MKKKSISIVVAVSVVTAIVIVVMILRAHKIDHKNKVEWARMQLHMQVMDLGDMVRDKKFKDAIDFAEKLKAAGHADNPLLQGAGLNLAKAYFHEKRYSDAADACLIYLRLMERQKDPKDLDWVGSVRRAKYLSFLYAQTGDPQDKLATIDQIRDSLDRNPSDMTPFGFYSYYGPIKHRLETRQMLTDEEYLKANKKEFDKDPYHIDKLMKSVSLRLVSLTKQ